MTTEVTKDKKTGLISLLFAKYMRVQFVIAFCLCAFPVLVCALVIAYSCWILLRVSCGTTIFKTGLEKSTLNSFANVVISSIFFATNVTLCLLWLVSIFDIKCTWSFHGKWHYTNYYYFYYYSCYIFQLVRALWLANLAGRIFLYGPLKFKVSFVSKLFRDLLPGVLNFYSNWKLKTFLYCKLRNKTCYQFQIDSFCFRGASKIWSLSESAWIEICSEPRSRDITNVLLTSSSRPRR